MEIFGITVNTPQIENWQDSFDSVYDDGDTTIFISKETFKHDCDDDLNFEYKYMVEVCEFNGKWYCSLNLVVLPKCLHPEVLADIATCSGIEPDEVTCEDVLQYGLGIKMADCMQDEVFDEDVTLLAIANVIDCIDSLRGFYLDKHINMIGTTGWDMIKHCVLNENWLKV